MTVPHAPTGASGAGTVNGGGLNTPVEIPWPQPLVPVRVLRRVNRFVVEAAGDPGETSTGAETLRLHLPNSGRMEELLVPGAEGRARLWGSAPGRRTRGELLLVRHRERWVSVDARMPNRLFAACLEARAIPAFAGATGWRREVLWGAGRIDFLVEEPAPSPPWLVETKSCNLVEAGVALFPDAPTLRGARHLRELAAAAAEGRHRAAVVWFVQRDDAVRLEPHRRADPDFARALREARSAGVEALAYRCGVTEDSIRVLGPIPVAMLTSRAAAGPARRAARRPEG